MIGCDLSVRVCYVIHIMEFTDQEIKNMVEVFKRKNVKPKADTPDDFEAWLTTFSALKVEPSLDGETNSDATSQAKTTVYQRYPKIPPFSGDKQGKDTPYDVWRYHVDGLLESTTYPSDIKDQVIRDSLKGEAARIAVNMRPGSTILTLLKKLRIVFGIAERKETRMAQFYSAKQKEDEEVSTWGCRLEELLSHAMKDSHGSIEDSDKMLRNMLWTGLKPSLKNISGHKFDSIDNFDDLLESLREIEHDQLSTPSSIKHKPTVAFKLTTEEEPEWKKEMSEMKMMINQLCTQVSDMKQASSAGVNLPRQSDYHRRSPSPARRGRDVSCVDQDRQQGQGYREQGQGYREQGQGYREQGHSYREQGYEASRRPGPAPNYQDQDYGGQASGTEYRSHGTRGPPTCWRCGQIGHTRYNCHVRLDHSRRGQALNSQMSMGRGHQ